MYGDSNHANRITQVLIEAGVAHPGVLLAGVLLGAVRDGGCPLTEVQRRFGDQVAVLIARQLPPPSQAGRVSRRSRGHRAIPPEWVAVAGELPLAAELLALADLCVLRDIDPQASRTGRAATSSAGGGRRRPGASARPATMRLPRPRQAADPGPPDPDRAHNQAALPADRGGGAVTGPTSFSTLPSAVFGPDAGHAGLRPLAPGQPVGPCRANPVSPRTVQSGA